MDKIIIGVTGLIGAGKDTVADYLVNTYEFRRESFATSLKDAVGNIFGWDRTMLEGKTAQARAWREEVDTWWATQLNMPHLTPRWVLQYFGTDVLRNNLHDDIWIASLERKLLSSTDNIVISDCRFKNEVAMIRGNGGVIVQVQREPLPAWHNIAELANAPKGPDGVYPPSRDIAIAALKMQKIHPSEYSLAGVSPNIVLDNTGSINELYSQINNLVTNLRRATANPTT